MKISLHQSNIGHALLRVEFCKDVSLFEGDVRFWGHSVWGLWPRNFN